MPGPVYLPMEGVLGLEFYQVHRVGNLIGENLEPLVYHSQPGLEPHEAVTKSWA